jgi:hypothetical protein
MNIFQYDNNWKTRLIVIFEMNWSRDCMYGHKCGVFGVIVKVVVLPIGIFGWGFREWVGGL